MPAGSFASGVGPAGHDPVGRSSSRDVASPLSAARYEPSVRDYPLDPGGRLLAGDAVDQAVMLALTIERGALASVPGLGHSLRALRRGSLAQTKTAARDAVVRALSKLTARGDVTLLSVEVAQPARGQTLVTVSYRNNRLSPPATRTIVPRG